MAAGDIGDHFPPTDPQWKGVASEVFLQRSADLARAAGWRIAHVDVTILCEAPRIKPHRLAMRQATARVLGLPLDAVSVKATTTEQLGFLGRREGIAALATATLTRG
jgi:2-C-methyl-D-erythritol 4-phosphate cytidylyltransferase/2-C-methyl-D-erythritol 2,4-cyclodiphosphate synthase